MRLRHGFHLPAPPAPNYPTHTLLGYQGIGSSDRSMKHGSVFSRQVGSVIRRNWLIAAFTAVFVLQTPLCVMACVSSQDSPAVVEAEPHSAPPCHESTPNRAASKPSEPPSETPTQSHNECGCDDTYTAVFAKVSEASTNLPPPAVVTPGALADPFHVNLVWVPRTHLRSLGHFCSHAGQRDWNLARPRYSLW